MDAPLLPAPAPPSSSPPPSMPLLTQTEASAFQSFLSQVDYADFSFAPEWSMYTDHVVDDPSRTHKDQLSRATKDLMALDAFNGASWPDHTPSPHFHPQHTLPPQSPSFPLFSSHQRAHTDPSLQPQHGGHQALFQQQQHAQAQQAFQLNQPSFNTYVVPGRTPPTNIRSLSDQVLSTRPRTASSASSSSLLIGSPLAKRFGEPLGPAYKRRRPSPIDIGSQRPGSTFATRPSRPRAATVSVLSSIARSTSGVRTPTSAAFLNSPQSALLSVPPTPASASAAGGSTGLPPPLSAPGSKPALLSPSQKKANHIQSEQKRRANIRRGYEALCDCVPPLRDAIRQQEAEDAAARAEEAGRRGGPKKKRTRAKVGEDGEKVDGRAGPKSECIVLQKTIDYISDLQSEQRTLLERLQRVRGVLGAPPPPADASVPAWEREWSGGSGSTADGDGDDEDED